MSRLQPSRSTFPPKQRKASIDKQGQLIYLVDNDARVREALSDLSRRSAERSPASDRPKNIFGATEMIQRRVLLSISCFLDMSGLDLQEQLEAGLHPTIIFMSALADVPTTERAMKAGAIEFLIKPVKSQDLITAFEAALAQDLLERERYLELAKIRQRHSSLASREREVLPLITGGILNKQAAAYLGISDVTLQVHRGQVMRKMAAQSFAELVLMASKLGITESTHS